MQTDKGKISLDKSPKIRKHINKKDNSWNT